MAGVEILCDDLQNVSEANLNSATDVPMSATTTNMRTKNGTKFPKMFPSIETVNSNKLHPSMKNVDIRVKIYRKAFD